MAHEVVLEEVDLEILAHDEAEYFHLLRIEIHHLLCSRVVSFFEQDVKDHLLLFVQFDFLEFVETEVSQTISQSFLDWYK